MRFIKTRILILFKSFQLKTKKKKIKMKLF